MEALLYYLKQEAKENVSFGDDRVKEYGWGMMKVIDAIESNIKSESQIDSEDCDLEPITFLTQRILEDVAKDIKKAIKKKQKQYLSNTDEDYNQIRRIELQIKSLELIIIKHILEIGKDFNLGKVIEAIEKQS